MKKKVGIITFHDADNLGAVLQAFSLQETLNSKESISANIIDYKNDAILSTRVPPKATGIKNFPRHLLLTGYYAIKRKGFQTFRKKYLKLSKKKYTRENIFDALDTYDAFITGSDQVWNLRCSENDYSYFLDFVPDSKKKYSYAASLGSYVFTQEESPRISALLNDFSHLSIREYSAKEELTRIGVTNVAVHCDPVFLQSCGHWKKLMSKRLCKVKYVFVYLVLPDVNVMNAARKYAEDNNCKIISNKKSLEFILHNNPRDFLSWIYYADCVFTNSFHGTAFSLIFNKRLAADIHALDGKLNQRINGILSLAQAETCIIRDDSYMGAIPNAEQALIQLQKTAMDYIDKITEKILL